jgi:uncharacterized integral membrane protein (TIGR00698 family)
VESVFMERPRRRAAAARALLPGLLGVAAATAVAYAISAVWPAVNPSSMAVLLGLLWANTGWHRPVVRPGTRFAGHRLLRVAVVLLGLQLSVPALLRLGGRGLLVVLVTVTVTFFGTQLLGRALGVPRPLRLLVATGFSICGASAIAAMEPVADGEPGDTGVAVALVTLCGSLAILLLPLLRVPLGLDVSSFGSWVGASVHDVGQTVATASRVPGALSTAVVVKLSRVVLLAPLVAGVGYVRRTRTTSTGQRRRTPPMPLFVAGFLAAVLAASVLPLPGALLSVAHWAQGLLLTAALVGLGTGIHLPTLRRTGGRALALGGLSWLLVASVAYVGVRLAG